MAATEEDAAAQRGSPGGHRGAPDEEHLTVAPIVGPEDPRRFTDSGIEVAELYTQDDLPAELDLGEPGEFPYTRGVHREMYRKQTWTMRQYAGYASAQGVQRALPLPALQGLDRPVDGLRPAHPAGPRLRQPALPGRGRPHGRGDRHDRRHAHRLRRHPARPGLDVDDDQRARRVPAAALRARRRGAGRPSEKLRGTTQNDVLKEYIARGNYIYPPGRRCG